MFVKLHTLEKAELNSDIDLIIVKVKIELLQKKIEKFHRNFFLNIIASIVTQALMIEILFSLNNARCISS